MKKILYNIRASIIRFLIKICTFLGGRCYCKNEFYYETTKIKIFDINNSIKKNRFEGACLCSLISTNIDPPNDVDTWRELVEDIKSNGIRVNPQILKSEYGYEIYDGNHRLKILEHLYGGDYEVTVDIYLNHKKYIPYYAIMGVIDEVEEQKLKIKRVNKRINWKTYEE